MPRPHFLAPLLRGNGRRFALRNTRNGELVAGSVETAFDSSTRRRGLLGRSGIPEGTALVLAPCGAVHTIGMQFPIDVVFASRDGRVRKVRTGVPPWRMAASLGSFAVIELSSNGAARSGTRPGDALEIVSVPVEEGGQS